MTERDEFGNTDIIGVDSMDLQCNLEFDEFNKVTNALNKLAEYEDLEEQGKLLKLLCGVGAELWAITTIKSYSLGLPKKEFLEHPQKKRVESITLSRNGILYHARGMAFHDYHFGKEVFFTEKEAEAALKELERGKGE